MARLVTVLDWDVLVEDGCERRIIPLVNVQWGPGDVLARDDAYVLTVVDFDGRWSVVPTPGSSSMSKTACLYLSGSFPT